MDTTTDHDAGAGAGGADRLQLARDVFRAYATGDRALVEERLAPDLVFSAPPDVRIDRAAYFERCWPNAGTITAYAFARLAEVGDEVLVTYEATRTDGSRFRNTEILGFDGDRISRVEVYFGWNLDGERRRPPRPGRWA